MLLSGLLHVIVVVMIALNASGAHARGRYACVVDMLARSRVLRV